MNPTDSWQRLGDVLTTDRLDLGGSADRDYLTIVVNGLAVGSMRSALRAREIAHTIQQNGFRAIVLTGAHSAPPTQNNDDVGAGTGDGQDSANQPHEKPWATCYGESRRQEHHYEAHKPRHPKRGNVPVHTFLSAFQAGIGGEHWAHGHQLIETDVGRDHLADRRFLIIEATKKFVISATGGVFLPPSVRRTCRLALVAGTPTHGFLLLLAVYPRAPSHTDRAHVVHKSPLERDASGSHQVTTSRGATLSINAGILRESAEDSAPGGEYGAGTELLCGWGRI